MVQAADLHFITTSSSPGARESASCGRAALFCYGDEVQRMAAAPAQTIATGHEFTRNVSDVINKDHGSGAAR